MFTGSLFHLYSSLLSCLWNLGTLPPRPDPCCQCSKLVRSFHFRGRQKTWTSILPPTLRSSATLESSLTSLGLSFLMCKMEM